MPRRVSAVVHWVLSGAVFTLWMVGLKLAWNWAGSLGSTVAIVAVLSVASEAVHDLYAERKRARREGRAARSFFALADRPVTLPARRLDGAGLGRLVAQLVTYVALIVGLGWALGYRDHRLLAPAVTVLALYVVGKALVGDGGDRNGASPRSPHAAPFGL